MTKWIMLLLCTFVISGCEQPDYRYAHAFNAERQKLGLEPIPDDWLLSYNGRGSFSAVRPDRGQIDGSYYFSKNVVTRNGELVSEQDTYRSGRKFEYRDGGTLSEKIIISYYYDREGKGEDPWVPSALLASDYGAISMERADEILASWGLSRPSPPGVPE